MEGSEIVLAHCMVRRGLFLHRQTNRSAKPSVRLKHFISPTSGLEGMAERPDGTCSVYGLGLR